MGKRLWSYGAKVAIAAITLIGISVLTEPLTHPSDLQCDVEAFLSNPRQTLQVHAIKVVVRPWLGEHNVYGIFVVPDQFSPKMLLNVKTIGSYCGQLYVPNKRIDGIPAPAGTFLLKHYIRTRAVLQSILKGNLNQLTQLDNWTLFYREKR